MDMGSFAELLEEVLPEGWHLDQPDMGIESLLVAPCSAVIELDGVCDCPERHVSPLRELGLI